MKSSPDLTPLFTVPNDHQQLNAVRPVQVYTYFFGGRRAPSQPTFGSVHVFEGATRLIPHDHEHHEFAIVLSGSAIHCTRKGERPVHRGSVMAVAPADVHAFEDVRQLWLVNCTYLTEYLFYDVREILSVDGLAPLFFHGAIAGGGVRLHLPEWELDEKLLDLCMRELADIAEERVREDASPLFMRRTLEKLMLVLHRSFQSSGQPSHVPVDLVARRAVERIEEILLTGEPFDATVLARAAGVSRARLAKMFRRTTGRTPSDYYQHRRVQEACCLLLDARADVTSVALELGYYDTAHFSRMFKRHRGIGPKAFQLKYAAR